MVLEFLTLFFAVFFWGSPVGLSIFLGHVGVITISLWHLRNLSQTYFFWIILLIVFLFAQEPRFSIEYFLLACTIFCVGASGTWSNTDQKYEDKRRRFLFLLFVFLILVNHFHLDFSERGSLLLYLPVYLSLYYKGVNKKNFLVYLMSGLALFFSNKLTTLLAFIFCLRNKFLYVLSFLLIPAYFFYKRSVITFFIKSFKPRLYIWESSWNAFLDKPLFGHGFGTFALDFPPYRAHAKVLGGRISEQVVHGHSLFSHYGFELGLLGLLLAAILFYLVYVNAPRVFLPLLVISLCDAPLVTFNQFLLAGLLIVPFVKDSGVIKKVFYKFQNKFIRNIFFIFSFLLSLFVFIPSLVGHYYYDRGNIDKAIQWDRKNSLYYFTRGANRLNKNTIQSEEDFLQAIKLSPNVSYFHGFLGASQLANNKISEAKKTLEGAMKLDGQDGYWCLLYSYANYNDKKIFREYRKKALKKNPEIKNILSNPHLTSARYIGSGKGGDVRLAGFYRRGKEIYFPLPVVK